MSVTYVSSLSLSLSPRCVSVHLFTCQSEMSNGNWMINCWLIPMIAKSYYLFFLEMYLEISFHIRWATLYYFVLLLTPLLVSKSSLLQWRWWTNEVAYFCTPFIQSTDDQLTNEQERSVHVHVPIDVTGCLCTYEDMGIRGRESTGNNRMLSRIVENW